MKPVTNISSHLSEEDPIVRPVFAPGKYVNHLSCAGSQDLFLNQENIYGMRIGSVINPRIWTTTCMITLEGQQQRNSHQLQRPTGETSATDARLSAAQHTEHVLLNQGNGDPRVDSTSMGSSNVFGSMIDSDDGLEAPPIEFVTSVEEMLSLLSPQIPENSSIFRVPIKFRQLNEKAYTPHMVSIGPLHWGNPELIGMEDFKKRHLKAFLSRTAMTTERCLGLIRRLEQQVRSCYAETLVLSSDEFVKMVLVDSGFIIESILRYSSETEERGFIHYVGLDLILVENQLPFFLLNRIFDLAFTHYPLNNNQPTQLLQLLVDFFRTILLINNPDTTEISSSTVKHLADLVRILHLPLPRRRPTRRRHNQSYVRVQNTTALKQAGVKFKRKYDKGFLEMEFTKNGVLKIPQLCLNNSAEPLFRNLIALEFYLYEHDSYILDCAVFMDDLISTGKDVDILVDNGVIKNYIGESEIVADMFNKLTSQYLVRSYNFHDVSKDLYSFYEDPQNMWIATLKEGYCSTPFKVVSVVLATILLLLTLLQTVGTIVGLSTKDTGLSFKVTAIVIAATVIAVTVIIFFHVLLRVIAIYVKIYRRIFRPLATLVNEM